MPSIILTSKFTPPDAGDFTKYLEYITRKEAIKKNENNREQQVLEFAINNFEMGFGRENLESTSLDMNEFINKTNSLSAQKEAIHVMKQNGYSEYFEYMRRSEALEKESQPMKNEDQMLNGVFTKGQDIVMRKDINKITNIMAEGHKRGSILYQDVISFETDFLIEHNILSPLDNKLNEERLIKASRKMMDKLFEEENISSGFWVGSIHRNTDHVHIHYASIENENTRKLLTFNKGNTKLIQPKGKRKQSTLDEMKYTFTNSLIDRTNELSRISNLRNTLVKDIKDQFALEKNDVELSSVLLAIQKELPSNKKDWNYGGRKVSNHTRDKIDYAVSLLMEDNEQFNDYGQLVNEENEYRIKLYGDSGREEKNYKKNKQLEINKRLGNSLLKEMKKVDNRAKEINQRIEPTPPSKMKKIDFKTQHNLWKFQSTLNSMKSHIKNDYEMYLAEKEFENTQRKAELEKG